MATLRQLKTFIAVAEYKKMSEAAKHLYISQPTVSQIISELEKEYNTQLFERIGKELRITAAGNLLLRSAQEIFAIHDKQVINRIRDVDGGEKMVMWMRWSMDEGKKIPQDVVEWLSRNDIEQSEVSFIKDRMSLQQIMNYVNRQQAECYRSKTA